MCDRDKVLRLLSTWPKGGLILLILGLVCSAAHPHGNENEIVAKVGERTITVNDIKAALRRKFQSPARIENLSLQEKQSCLADVIEKMLLLNEAYRRKLYNDEAIVESVRQFRAEAMKDKLIEHAVVDSILTEERLMEFYRKYGGEIRLRQIFIPTPSSGLWSQPGDSLGDNKAKEVAEKLYNDILSGEEFATMAREHSQDMNTAANGGDAGYVRWGQLTKEVQDVAFALPVGTVSAPIRSTLGYHIIQIMGKVKPPFDAEKGTIKYQLAATYGRTIQSRQDQYFNTLATSYRVAFHYSNFERLAKSVGPHYAPFSTLKEKEKKLPLASFVGGAITVGDLVTRTGSAAVNYRWDERNIENWTRRLTLEAIMLKEAHARKIDVSADVLQFKEERIIELLKEREIDGRVTTSEVDLRKYFDQHREQFQNPEMVHVKEILLNEPYLANHVAERAKQGEDFDRLVQENSLRSESRQSNGDLGYIGRDRYQEIFDAAVGRHSGEIYGPFRITEGLSVIKVLDRRPPQAQTFEEARTKINYLVVEEKQHTRYAELIGELRRRYSTEVLKDVLESIVLSNN